MSFRNRSVDVHKFAMIPRADVPRSSFKMETMHKTTFDVGTLIPVYVDEVLPGDTFNLRMTAFGRLATPLYPIMDNLWLDTFFFFVPCRLVWENWQKFQGEQDNPDDSTSFVIPQIVSPAGGYDALSVFDYMGLPVEGQVTAGQTITHSALPFRAYNLIFKEWFRDENLQDSPVVHKGDGPDPVTDYNVWPRGKRHDYFTSCLPWPQKGDSVTMPLGTLAPVYPTGPAPTFQNLAGTLGNQRLTGTNGSAAVTWTNNQIDTGERYWDEPNLVTDLSEATAATINQLRQSFQIQKVLERDARGGTRYTEIVRAHFGVISPDARLQRPEYLGGGTSPLRINPIAQTSETLDGSPQGHLAAMGTVTANGHGFSQSFTEHGYIIGLAAVRADLTYQQGMRKMWSRSTRFDFYMPAFAALGEQAVLNKELYCTGTDADDDGVFGYQERWAEYRYHPSQITGMFRSTTTGTLDGWHLAQRFSSLPVLNDAFIRESIPMSRILAAGSEANGQQILFDSFFQIRASRPMPMYSVPGLIDHF